MSAPPPRPTSLVARVFTVLAIAGVLALTLWPVDSRGTPVTANCIICGDRGLADALLNVALFAPLGVAVAMRGWRLRHALLAAAALSALVEVAQAIVPGRDPGVGDLLFNSIGGVSGVLAWRFVRRFVTRPHPMDTLAGPTAAAVVAGVFAVAAWAFGAALPQRRIAALWTPDFKFVERYTGRVESARLGVMPVPDATELDPAALRERFAAGDTLVVRGIGGRTPGFLSPVLAIVDFDGNEVVTFGFNRRDVVFRYRLRAAAIRLSSPGVRLFEGGIDVRPGEPLDLRARRGARDVCLWVGTRGRCGIGYDLAASWRLLIDWPSLAPGPRRLLGLAWVALLAFPVGFLSRSWRSAGAAVAALVGVLALLPVLAGLLPTPLPAYLSLVVAGLTGSWLGQRLTNGMASRPAVRAAA